MNASNGLVRAGLAGAVVGLLSAAVLGAGFALTGPQPLRLGGIASNGERIFKTATSERGTPIDMSIGRMHMGATMGMGGGGMMTCADCHGADGRGGAVTMMMLGSFEPPDIRYRTLTQPHQGAPGEPEHLPYDDATLRQAITQGLDPAGATLEFPMPRWQMSDEDLADLIAYLKTLP